MILFININLSANILFGSLTKVSGNVILQNGKILKQNDKVYIKDTIITHKHSKVVILQTNGNVITIGHNSIFKIIKEDEVEQKSGKSFFNIVHKIQGFKKKDIFRIKFKTTTIGIRGTNFIVDSKNHGNVILRKGSLNFKSNNKKYKIYKKSKSNYANYSKQQQEEIDNYINNMNNEFLEYKKKLEFEFEQYAKSFYLKENTMLVFGQDNEVFKIKVTKDILEKEFENFDRYTNSIVQKEITRDIEKSVNNKTNDFASEKLLNNMSYDSISNGNNKLEFTIE